MAWWQPSSAVRWSSLRPDPEHPNSRGFACSKGIAFPAVRVDPDRVLQPLRREPDGSFAPVSWDVALDDIGRRLRAVIKSHGRESIGVYLGNPNGWNYGAFLSLIGLCAALKTKHFYGATSVDINNYWAVGQLLYGNNLANPVPDLHRTDFFLCIGANPVISHGSMINIGRVRETMLGIVERGGRVVVVDPRRTETAELFEHLPIRPSGDVWLLAAMLKVIFDERLQDRRALEQTTRGHETLPMLVRGIDLDRAARETGIPVERITNLARDFAAAPSASVSGAAGLARPLRDTGQVPDRRAQYRYRQPRSPRRMVLRASHARHRETDRAAQAQRLRPLAYPRRRHPRSFWHLADGDAAREIRTPGPGQLRAMVIASGNPVTSGPASGQIEQTLQELDLLVSLDPYITETSRLAHYVLPPALWLEREGMPIFTQSHSAVPYAQWVPATVPPPKEVREDGQMVRLLASPECDDPDYPLRLFSVRELRSQNSWLHNVPKLMAADRVQRLRVRPQDADELGIDVGDEVEIASRHGRIIPPARVSDDGELAQARSVCRKRWGHRGAAPSPRAGPPSNLLTTNAPSEVDLPTGNAVFNGVAVRVRRLVTAKEES